jgi:hypothetical protein
MAWNMSYYMNSCITAEYTDHEVFKISTQRERYKRRHSTMQGPASSPKMRSPRHLFRARAPSWLSSPPVGRHCAIQICHSTRSTQAFLQRKRSTNKDWVTKAQQDWPVNVAINSRLLACQASRESFILMPNSHYERVLTFKILALIKNLEERYTLL